MARRSRIRAPGTAPGSRPTSPTRAPAPRARRALLGREPRNGHVLQAAFFSDRAVLLAALRDMPGRELRQFDMRGVGWINQLYGPDTELRLLQRRDARLVANTTMM